MRFTRALKLSLAGAAGLAGCSLDFLTPSRDWEKLTAVSTATLSAASAVVDLER
jgi:hypothetical protein